VTGWTPSGRQRPATVTLVGTTTDVDTELLARLDAELSDELACEWGDQRAGRASDPPCAEAAECKVYWRPVCRAGKHNPGDSMSLFCMGHAARLTSCVDESRCAACRMPLAGDIWHSVERVELLPR
jgi:hypothetical protein